MSLVTANQLSTALAADAIETALSPEMEIPWKGSEIGFADPVLKMKMNVVAAGAAIVLERSGFSPILSDQKPAAEDFLDDLSVSYPFFLGAMSRMAGRNESELKDASGSDLVKDVVADVMQTSSARFIVMATANRSLLPDLSPSQQTLADMAREDRGLLKDMSSIAIGAFDRLSPEMNDSLEIALAEPLPGKLGIEASFVGRAVDNILASQENLESAFEKSSIGFDSRFVPVSEESLKMVYDFHSHGHSTGTKEMDTAFQLIFDRELVPMNYDIGHPMMIAQARLIEQGAENHSQSPVDLAAMAITDAKIMLKASYGEGYDEMIGLPKSDLPAVQNGRYHELEGTRQEMMAGDIMMGHLVAPIDRVRMEVEVLEGRYNDLEKGRDLSSGMPSAKTQSEMSPRKDVALISALMASQARGMGV